MSTSSSWIPRICSVEKKDISSFKTRLYQVSPFHTENLQCGQGRYIIFHNKALSYSNALQFIHRSCSVDKEDIIFHNKALFHKVSHSNALQTFSSDQNRWRCLCWSKSVLNSRILLHHILAFIKQIVWMKIMLIFPYNLKCLILQIVCSYLDY